MNTNKNPKKVKTIILAVLLGLALAFLVTAAVVRSIKANRPIEANNLISNAATTENADNSGVGIVPLGWWEDLWNIAEEKDVYGTVHAGDKYTTVSSGSYTNKAYGYTAPDGFPAFQYSYDNKNWDYTVQGTHQMFANTNSDGWRYYRGYMNDKKGDYSKVSSICLDTVKPQLQVRLNGNSIASGSVTTLSGSYFSMFATDDNSGVESYWYKVGSGSYYECSSGTYFYGDGVYSFYVKDRAGNVSDTVTVTRDTTAPTVRAYNGTSLISNGEYVNTASVRFEATDSTSGVSGIYIRTPSSSVYSNYGVAATLSTEGLYY